MEKQYTKDITSELIAQMKAPYSAEEMALMDEGWRAAFDAFALVSSQLANGDEIISTPLADVLMAQRDNSEPLPDDFLAPVPECE